MHRHLSKSSFLLFRHQHQQQQQQQNDAPGTISDLDGKFLFCLFINTSVAGMI